MKIETRRIQFYSMLYSQNILARALMIFIRFRCPVCENNYSRLLNKQNYRLNRYLSTSINKTDPIPSLVRDLVAWRVCLALQATHKMKKKLYVYMASYTMPIWSHKDDAENKTGFTTTCQSDTSTAYDKIMSMAGSAKHFTARSMRPTQIAPVQSLTRTNQSL